MRDEHCGKAPRELRTVRNALRLLMSLAEPPGVRSVSQLSRDLGLGKSVVYSLLTTLKSFGFVEQDPHRSYRLGYRILALAEAAQGNFGIRGVALPVMQKLARETEESVYLMVLGRFMGILLERVDPPNPIRVTMEVGQQGYLHAGSSHKVMLAFLGEEEIDEYIATTGLPRLTPHTITDPAELRRQLTEIRRRGYAYTEEESFEGIAGLAAPIFDRRGRVVASVGIAGLVQRLRVRYVNFVPLVVSAAEEISRALGHTCGAGNNGRYIHEGVGRDQHGPG